MPLGLLLPFIAVIHFVERGDSPELCARIFFVTFLLVNLLPKKNLVCGFSVYICFDIFGNRRTVVLAFNPVMIHERVSRWRYADVFFAENHVTRPFATLFVARNSHCYFHCYCYFLLTLP